MDRKNFINIKAEALEEGTIKANFKGGAKNLNQLISLGSAILTTYLQSAVEIVRQNASEEIEANDEFIQLIIVEALIDRIGNLINIQDTQDKEDAVDSFLQDIFNGRNKN